MGSSFAQTASLSAVVKRLLVVVARLRRAVRGPSRSRAGARVRAAEQGSGLGRLRRRVGSVLDDVRAARRRRRRGELHLSRAAARARREDGLLGDEPASQRVGTPTNPIDPDLVEDWADRVFYRAVASSSCATPWIALNEMFGSNLATPWSPTNAQYRDNVLRFVRRLNALGAHPFLLLNSRPSRTARPATGGGRWPSARTSCARSTSPRRRSTTRPSARVADAAERLPPGSDRPDLDRHPASRRSGSSSASTRTRARAAASTSSRRARGSTRSSGRCSRSSR